MTDDITSLFSRWIKWEVYWDSNDDLGFRELTISYLIQRLYRFTSHSLYYRKQQLDIQGFFGGEEL